MDKEPSPTATAIAAVLYGPKSSLKNIVSREAADDVARDMDALLNAYGRRLLNHLRNAASLEYTPDAKDPKFPDHSGDTKLYPKIEHEHEPVPDPAETETSEASKESIPDYSEYQDHVRVLEASGQTLWDDTAGRDEKVQSIKDAREAMDNILGMLKQF